MNDDKAGTQLMQELEALRQREARYHRLFEESPLGIFHSTLDGRFIDVNPALARLLGYTSPQDVLDAIHNIADQVYVVPPRREVIVEQVLGQDRIARLENRYRRRDGREWVGALQLRCVRDSGGAPVHLEGFVEEMTGRSREPALLSGINQAFVSAGQDADRALAAILDQARQVLGIIACLAWLVDPVSGEPICRQVAAPPTK